MKTLLTALPLLLAVAWLGLLFYAGHVFVSNDYSSAGMLGWIMSIGLLGGMIAINLGHELIHQHQHRQRTKEVPHVEVLGRVILANVLVPRIDNWKTFVYPVH